MAYSMFERPKLHIAESMKFYPEQYDHPSSVPYRHKTVSPNFSLTPNNSTNSSPKNSSNNNKSEQKNQSSKFAHEKKCPIYVHNFVKIKNIPSISTNLMSHNSRYNSPVKRSEIVNEQQHKLLNKHKPNVSIEKLEESYWASWKPSREQTHNKYKSRNEDVIALEKKLIQMEQDNRHLFTDSNDTVYYQSEKPKTKVNEIQTISQEIQTDLPELDTLQETLAKATETELNTNILKHTDSFILTSKKQHSESKERFEQPKCIRLYKKPGYTPSNNYIKGGSYPLKSCLKKESMYSKGNIRLGPPGSSLIVSTSFNGRYSRNYRK